MKNYTIINIQFLANNVNRISDLIEDLINKLTIDRRREVLCKIDFPGNGCSFVKLTVKQMFRDGAKLIPYCSWPCFLL